MSGSPTSIICAIVMHTESKFSFQRTWVLVQNNTQGNYNTHNNEDNSMQVDSNINGSNLNVERSVAVQAQMQNTVNANEVRQFQLYINSCYKP